MKEEMMDELCASRNGFRLILYISISALGLMLLWAPFVEPGSGTQVVVFINIVAASGFILFSGFFVWQCRKRAEERQERIRQL